MNETPLNTIAQLSMNGEQGVNKPAQAPAARHCNWSIAVTLFIAIGIPGVPAVSQGVHRFVGPLVITAVLVGLATGIAALVARKLWRLRSKRA